MSGLTDWTIVRPGVAVSIGGAGRTVIRFVVRRGGRCVEGTRCIDRTRGARRPLDPARVWARAPRAIVAARAFTHREMRAAATPVRRWLVEGPTS